MRSDGIARSKTFAMWIVLILPLARQLWSVSAHLAAPDVTGSYYTNRHTIDRRRRRNRWIKSPLDRDMQGSFDFCGHGKDPALSPTSGGGAKIQVPYQPSEFSTTATAVTLSLVPRHLFRISNFSNRRPNRRKFRKLPCDPAHRNRFPAVMTASTKTMAPAKRTKDDVDGDYASYNDLNVIGKAIAGAVEIALTIATEYCTGFASGYFLGSVVGIPALITRRVASDASRAVPDTAWKEVVGRTLRMHGKSVRWAKSWAGVSATFGGCNTGVKFLRNGKNDEWSSVFSSMAAGAFFARGGKCRMSYVVGRLQRSWVLVVSWCPNLLECFCFY